MIGLISSVLLGATLAAVAAAGAARSGVLRWRTFERVLGPLSLAMGRSDGLPVLAANGRLFVLQRSGRLTRFAPAYRSSPADEAEIAVPGAGHRHCSFGADNVYALRVENGQGVTRITARGRVRRFAAIDVPGLADGIAFDDVGRFGHRLLVTVGNGLTSTVLAINCHGQSSTITSSAPRIEGGMDVAPRSFGRFGGDLVAPGELDGRIWAITPAGRSIVVANSGLPHASYFGVGSEVFIPGSPGAVLLAADRGVPGNPYPGGDALLEIPVASLRSLGARAGDLLVATEGGGFADVIRCGPARCSVRYVAKGPTRSHVDGNIGYLAP